MTLNNQEQTTAEQSPESLNGSYPMEVRVVVPGSGPSMMETGTSYSMTETTAERSLSQASKRPRIFTRAWFNWVITVRIKALFVTAAILLGIVFAFQMQIDGINDANAKGVCDSRVASANTSRGVLLRVVDISDLFGDEPISEGAQLYIDSRTALVNEQYDKIIEGILADC